jgi:hypothetical protein
MDNEFNFVMTDDMSAGLYNNKVKDIYHSKSGAHLEAYEKFIKPLIDINYFKSKNAFSVLDICYGIGYNSKALLNNIINKSFSIDSLDTDRTLVALSPLIKDSIDNIDLKLFILESVLKGYNNFNEYYTEIYPYLNESYFQFFDNPILNLLSLIINHGYYLSYQPNSSSFLHNIYYRYISNQSKQDFKSTNNINFYINDARISLKNIDKKYDIVFLDAFSPQKDPTLWTIDFLSLISKHLDYNSVILSYSKSTPFRSALLELGFNVGKTFISEIDTGTIAAKNKSNIQNPLSDYDIKLINTKSGITYKDINLSLQPAEILSNREQEQKLSNRISHTKFLKMSES